MSRKVKIGVFGARRGMAMIRVLAHHPDAELVAICDQFDHLLKECEKLAQETNTKVTLYKDFEQFFNHDLDAVVLANYATEHAPYAVRAASGHVLMKCCLWRTWQSSGAVVPLRKAEGFRTRKTTLFQPPLNEAPLQQGDRRVAHGEGEYVHDCEPFGPNYIRDKNTQQYVFHIPCTHSISPYLQSLAQDLSGRF